jgi:formylglycine-generating enzyme required for sulfatase activity
MSTTRVERAAALAIALVSANAGAEPFRDAFAGVRAEREASGPELIAIRGGEFEMGNRPGDAAYTVESPRHRVSLSDFAIGRYEVTRAEYAAFLNATRPLRDRASEYLAWRDVPGFTLDRGYPITLDGAHDREPIAGVTWPGAIAYVRWLSARTGRGYSLPTEAQWEYAARAGAATAWPWGDAFEPARVNCDDEHGRARPAGAGTPNAFGLYDTLGNVWEWTLDCLDSTFYLHSPARDPAAIDPACSTPVIRGGSYRDPAALCSPGYRVNFLASGSDTIGFRVARRLDARDGARRAHVSR